MNGLNKFKMITIVFICMFIFVVAAIYTNTKEASVQKLQTNQQGQSENGDANNIENGNTVSGDNPQIQDLYVRIDELSQRIEDLSHDRNSDGTSISCNIQGILNGDNIEELTQESAIQEARDNGKELVMICSF